MKALRKLNIILINIMFILCVTSFAYASESICITSQPANCSAKVGDMVSFHVEATGDNLNYQWQYKIPQKDTWKDCTSSSCNTNTFKFKMSSSYAGRQYRCIVTNREGDSVTSSAALLTEKIPQFKIVSQPEDCSVKIGDYAIFHVAAEGNNLTYQWQYKAATSNSWWNCTSTGGTTDTFKFKMYSSYSGRQYRCVITDEEGTSIESKSALLSEKVPLVNIISQPENCFANVGDIVKFHVEAEGNNLTYQWQYKLPTSTSWRNCTSSSYNTDTFKFKMVSSYVGRQYKCVITDEEGMSVESNAALLSQKRSQIHIISQPESCLATEGEAVAFHVKAEGNHLTYQWQYKLASATTWKDCTLASSKTDTFTFKMSKSYSGRQYRCLLSDADNDQLYTNIVDLTLAGCTSHNWLDGICTSCDLECEHKNPTYVGYNNGIHYAFCRECNTEGEDLPCVDADNDGTCDLCDASMPAACNHSWVDGICSECGVECIHDNLDQNGKCDTCGAVAFR